MKQFIVLMAVFPIMMLFLAQMGLDQKNSQITSSIQACVYAAKEEAKQNGCFTEDIIKGLKKDIAGCTGISEDKIAIKTDDKIKRRYSKADDRLIYYKVSVKIDEIMAGNRLYGISDKDNSYSYIIDSYTASERL